MEYLPTSPSPEHEEGKLPFLLSAEHSHRPRGAANPPPQPLLSKQGPNPFHFPSPPLHLHLFPNEGEKKTPKIKRKPQQKPNPKHMFHFPYNTNAVLLITPLFDNLFGNIWKALVNSPLHNAPTDGKHNPQRPAPMCCAELPWPHTSPSPRCQAAWMAAI